MDDLKDVKRATYDYVVKIVTVYKSEHG